MVFIKDISCGGGGSQLTRIWENALVLCGGEESTDKNMEYFTYFMRGGGRSTHKNMGYCTHFFSHKSYLNILLPQSTFSFTGQLLKAKTTSTKFMLVTSPLASVIKRFSLLSAVKVCSFVHNGHSN